MGQGEETKTREEPGVEIQERGEIFLFYRPKVGKEEAHGVEDVQRLYMVLQPESGERRFEEKQDPHSGKEGTSRSAEEEDEDGDDGEEGGGGGGGHGSQKVDIEMQPLLRFIVMGRKSLPEPTKRSTPYWGFVEMVTTKIDHVKAALRGEEYETATRGHRHLPDSRALGEGVYRILRHINPSGRKSKMHTHLVYKLKDFPTEETTDGDSSPQEALNVAREASFIIQIKNPDQHKGSHDHQFRGLNNKRKASFPAHMQGLFGHQRYHPADPPDFLNYEGCEFLLISASDDIEQELGLDLKTDDNEEDPQCSNLLDTFGDINEVFSRPLLKAAWA